MLQSGAWPKDMEYINCDDFQGGNTPQRNVDLREYFTKVALPTCTTHWGWLLTSMYLFLLHRLASRHPTEPSISSRNPENPSMATAIWSSKWT